MMKTQLHHKISPFLQGNSGAAAVEFSLVAPLLILLIVGLVDMGGYIKGRMKLEQISRASVDYILQGGQEDTIESNVIAYYAGEDANSYTLSTQRVCTCSDGVAQSCDNISCGRGDHSRQYIEISLDRTFNTLFTYPGIPHEMSLRGHARMRLD